MMTFTMTIAGVVKQVQLGSLSINQTANWRATASFSILSTNATYRPAIDAEVLMVENGTRIFGGLIDRPQERGLFGGSKRAITTTVNAIDFNAYAERRYVKETIAAGNLKAALTRVTTYLSGYGVTLDAAQVNGPDLPDLAYDYRRVDEVLNELATLTASAGEPFVWRIDAFKVLRMFQPSTVAAPFNLIGDTLPLVIGDVEVETTRQHYANRIILKTTSKTETNRIETFDGDGTTQTFVLAYTIESHRRFVALDTTTPIAFAGFKAYGFFNITANIADGETITIDGQTYTFESVFSNTAYSILIGSTPLQSKQRLVAAIMGSGTAGVDYGVGTVAHPTVEADIPADFGGGPNLVYIVTAKYRTVGVVGNGTPISDTVAAGDWFFEGNTRPGSLQGGADPGTTLAHVVLNESLNTVGDAESADWTYEPVFNSITRNLGAPAVGDIVSITFDGHFSGTFIAEDSTEIAAHGLVERVLLLEDVADTISGQALADSELAKSLSPTKTITYSTFASGIEPGQTQTVTIPARNLSATAVITDVVIRDQVTRFVRDVTAVVDASQTNLGRGWQDTYKAWIGDKGTGGSSATTTVGTTPVGIGPGWPNTAVQFNDNGAFGADDAFLYLKVENSLICGGGGSSITAADHESCQVFGDDNHIADP